MINLIKKLFQPKWVSVYISQNNVEYMRIKGKLIDSGIKHKTKMDSMTVNRNSNRNTRIPRIYEILVRIEDEHNARIAMGK